MGTGMVFDQEAQDKSGPFEIKEKDGCRGIACKISEAWHFGSEVRVAKQTVQILVGTAGPQPQAPDPSKTQRQPPFCIFSDKTLEDLCAKRPSNEEELLNVWGFGDVKVRKYGQDILHTIESVSSSQPSTSVPSTPAAAPASACDQQSSDERSLSKALMEVRSKLSEERSSLHPSRIFSNNMIAELCVKRPANQFLGEHWLPFANQMQELLQVKGFGEVKVREFGPDILHAIKAASPAAGERLEKGSGGTDVKGVLGWLMDKKSNRILHFEGPTASCGIELQANWQEKVVSTWSELRRAVRDTRDALLDRFMVLRVQGRIHVEEPLLLQRSVVLTGEPMDATLKEGSPPGELCGPASLGALVSVESGDATVVFWRLNLTLSSRDGSAVAKTASCMEVVSGRPVLVDCNLTASDDGTDAHEASESASTTGLWAGADTTVLMFGCSVTAARGAGVSLQGSACMVKCHVQRNLQGGVFVAEGGRLMAESCDINGNGHFSLVAGRGGGSAASAGPSSTRMSDVVHVDELHVESDDLVTEVVDVTGGSDDEDLVEVNKAGPPLYFHGYRRGRELGRGASGQVFVCHKKGDSSGGGGYAVKVVDLRRLHLQPNAEREEKKLSREVEILTRLPPHPNIVQLIDTFEDGDWFLLVLELVGGGDLYTVLTNREPPRLQEREAAFVVAQLVEGLSFLHSQGIIHRDMKLENVLVANERREKPLVFYTVKITDFGLSKAIGAGFSEARSTVGTRPYTAPEVLREDSHDFSSDLWCLGVLLFVLLAGHFPFNKIPTKQDELQHLVGKLKISDLSKSVLLGLLQLEPLKRLDLAGLARHEWICETIMEDEEEKPKRTRSVASASAVSAEARAGSAAVPPPKAEANSRAGSEENAKRSTGSAARSDWPRSRDGAATPNSANSATSQAPLPPPPPEAETQTATPEKPPPPPPPSPLSVPLPGQPVPALNSKRSMSMMFSHSEVLPSSLQQDVMQVHMVVPDRSWVIINKSGPQLKQISSTLGCQVRLISRKTVSEQRLVGDHRIVVIGTYYQCSVVQELVHGRMMQAQRAEGKEPTGEISVTLFVRAEAAGVVIGKQGWVLGRVRKQSGAKINLLREEVREAHLRSGHRRAGGDLSTSAAALAAAAAERSAGAQAVKDAVELGAVEWRGGDLERRHWMDSTRAAAESPPCLFAAAGTGVHSRQRRDQQRAAHGGPSGAFSSLRRSRRARCGAMLCHCLRRTAAVPVLPTVSGEKNLSRSIQVGRTDLTGSHAGSLWHCGGENSHVLLDQCSVSGSLAPNGAHVASPAVVASAYAMLTLWDCFAPSIRKGTLAAVIRAEANSNAMVAGDGPTLGWPGWSTKATKQKTRTEYAGGASIGQGNVAWMDVSGRFVPPAGASRSVTRAQRPSSASQSLQNWPAVNWNTSRGRTASTTSQMSDRDTEKMRASPPKEDPSAAQDLGDGAEAAPQVEDVTAGEMPAEEPAQGPSSTGAEGMETVEEEPEEDAAKESHVQWLRLRMENTANFGSEADRITLFELLQMLAVKDAHKEEVLDNIGLGGPIKHLDTVYLRGHTGLWMFVKNGTQLTCNSDDRTKSTAFVVEFKGGSTLKVDCLEARYAGQRPFLF
eukprot:s1112_g10.t1